MCVIFISDMLISPNEFKNYKKYGPTNQIWGNIKRSKEKHLKNMQVGLEMMKKIKEVYIDMVKN